MIAGALLHYLDSVLHTLHTIYNLFELCYLLVPFLVYTLGSGVMFLHQNFHLILCWLEKLVPALLTLKLLYNSKCGRGAKYLCCARW